MPTIGGIEMLVIAVVAIVVVGPRDLPKLLRSFGQVAGRMRGMAREFSDSMQDLAVESELEDMRRSIAAARNPLGALSDELQKTLDPTSGKPVTASVNDPEPVAKPAMVEDESAEALAPEAPGAASVVPEAAEAPSAKAGSPKAKAPKAQSETTDDHL